MRRAPRYLILTGLSAGVLCLAACGPADEAPEAMPEAAMPAPVVESTAFLDPNAASREQLVTVPGVDEMLASALVSGRPYADMTEVDAVVGDRLSAEQKDALYERVWMKLDLNSASEEEILLIPRVGNEMAHEFEEYRPFDAIERFRREIGKYVDEAEVARLEQYVSIR